MTERCTAQIWKRDTYRRTGRGKGGFEMHYSRQQCSRRALLSANWREPNGVWHPAGWYITADRRVRYRLCRERLTLDYLTPRQRLTPLGQAVREHLINTGHQP